MKKLYKKLFMITALALSVLKTNATVQQVGVANFAFTPSSFSINVGDTIVWFWMSGNHNTTSTNVPSGAMSWASPMNSGAPVFFYVPTVAGTYNYVCTFHGSMQANFVVTPSTGLTTLTSPPDFSFMSNNPASTELYVAYTIPVGTTVNIMMFDILGKTIQTIVLGRQQAGTYTKNIGIADLPRGIYILEMITPEARITKKVVVRN